VAIAPRGATELTSVIFSKSIFVSGHDFSRAAKVAKRIGLYRSNFYPDHESGGTPDSWHCEVFRPVGSHADSLAPATVKSAAIAHYSNLSDSTGSSCAARVAGSVPNTTPTSVAAAKAMMADNPEIGMRYDVNNRTE
jgi:hypothetical protein